MPETMLLVRLGEFREACRQAGLDPDSPDSRPVCVPRTGRQGCMAFMDIWDGDGGEVLVPSEHPATAYLSDAALAVAMY